MNRTELLLQNFIVLLEILAALRVAEHNPLDSKVHELPPKQVKRTPNQNKHDTSDQTKPPIFWKVVSLFKQHKTVRLTPFLAMETTERVKV